MWVQRCLTEGEENKILKKKKSSSMVSRVEEKESGKEASKYFSQGLHFSSDQRPRFEEFGRRQIGANRPKIFLFKM